MKLIETGHFEVNADGDPDLGLHGIFAQAVEGFDAKVLLDPLEEELDLPVSIRPELNEIQFKCVTSKNPFFSMIIMNVPIQKSSLAGH